MAAEGNARDVPAISATTLRLFRAIVRPSFRRHFRSVMVQQANRMPEVRCRLIVYANHSSWWDPMVCVLLADKLLPGRRHYAPMDAAALARYPILRRIGIFPVDTASARGAAQFLRTSQAVLEGGGVLWVTPQGRFADVREQPLEFKPGLGALAFRVDSLTLLPLAIEYTFWDERLPETLLRFGAPVKIAAQLHSDEATQQLEGALTSAMQELRCAAMMRDASAFDVLLHGRRGPGGFYGFGKRVRAMIMRRPLRLDHTERAITRNPQERS